MKYPLQLLRLIDMLKKLPGVGTKSAERFAFNILNWPQESLQQMADIVLATATHLRHCTHCGCLIGMEACQFCDISRQQQKAICIVAMPRDVFAIEATREYQGLYHVLGALLSPMDGIGPEQLSLDKLKARIASNDINEVVVALDSTLEGDATALFLKQQLEQFKVNISRLAFGLPMGSSFDYVDGGTLARALVARGQF